MAYHLMCESSKKIDWKEMNTYTSRLTAVEVLPMPGLGVDGGDAIGVCVPLKNVGKKAWREMKALLRTLLKIPQLCIYEMYSGKQITKRNMHELKSQIV